MSYLSKGMKSNNLIDVNQNTDLLSSSYKLSGNQHALELQEQIRAYRRELVKKDDLIAQLSARSPRHERFDLADTLLHTNASSDYQKRGNFSNFDSSAYAELAAARIKSENFLAELRELQSKLSMKDNYIDELKSKLHLANETSARQSTLIEALKEQVYKAERQSGTLEEITTKGSVTIQTLQCENREAQEKIIDLETRLRNHVLNREEVELEVDSYKRKYFDALTQLSDALNTDTEGGHLENSIEILVEKAKTVTQDLLLLQSKMQTMDDALNAHDLETKASRETIMRLVSEVGKEQKSISEVSNNIEKIKRERDDAQREKESLEREVELLNERLIANDKTWTSSREELTQTMTKANLLSEDVKRLEHEKTLIKTEFSMFKESMAKILSDPYIEVIPREDFIKDRIRELSASEREKKAQIDLLDARVKELTNQLERQCELHQDSIRRARRAESSAMQQENRLHDLESELATGDVVRETLRNDKAKYIGFMQEMAQAMRMDEVAADLGYDFNTDVLVARAHQLAKLEADELVEKNSSNYNLHKKVKTLKEQLKSKQLHMELLRKKIAQLEEKDQTRSALAIDRDDAIVTVQRLHRKVERLQHALGDEKVKVTQLKAQLAGTNELKAVTLEQRRTIDELKENVGKLSSTKLRQRQRLTDLKRNLSETEMNAGENNVRLRSQLDAITNDLTSTKTLLEEVRRREKQLVDFREVVARMLGLDVTTLAIPDYEVISRLEKLIRSHHIGTAASTALDRSLDAMSARFRAGYDDGRYRTISPNSHHSPSPPTYARGRDRSPRGWHHRSRSPSPKRY